VIFQLPYSVYEQYNRHSGNGQSALLQAVKSSVEKRYATTNVRADGQVIQIPFDDGITFELVPGFINKDDSYTFPNANDGGSWKVTNPKPEIKAIKDRNDACNKNLGPAVPDGARMEEQVGREDRRLIDRHVGLSVHRELPVSR
jgi:hypothetical protein